jgi:hypothetical protein
MFWKLRRDFTAFIGVDLLKASHAINSMRLEHEPGAVEPDSLVAHLAGFIQESLDQGTPERFIRVIYHTEFLKHSRVRPAEVFLAELKDFASVPKVGSDD